MTSNSSIYGSNLFCLREYKFCLSASKIRFANSLSSHLGIPNMISFSERCSILTFRMSSHFITSAQKRLEGSQEIKKCFKYSLILPQKEQAVDEIMTILQKRHLLQGTH